MQKDKDTRLSVVSIFLVIVVLLAAYVSYFNTKPSGGEGGGSLFPPYSISFPKDEGAHDEFSEMWMLVMNLSSEGNSFIFQVSWQYSNLDPDKVSIIFSVTDINNLTKTPFFSKAYTNQSFNYSRSYLNLEAPDVDGGCFDLKSTDNKTENYLLSVMPPSDSPWSIDALLSSERKPVLFTQNRGGTLLFGSLYVGDGTLFGYIQPNFDVVGNFRIGGEEFSARGSAMLLHFWGGAWSTIFDLIYSHQREDEVFALRYYSPGGNEVVLEQIYLIRNKDYILYSTFRNKTIGAIIEGKNLTSLEGNTYSFYPTSYVLDPRDPYSHRAFALNWSFYETYGKNNFTVHPYVKNQFIKSPRLWAGGTYSMTGGHFSGWGFSIYLKKYQSNPRITRIDFSQNNSIRVWVKDGIEMKNVIIQYNISNTTFGEKMRWNQDGSFWEFDLTGISSGENLQSYRIIATDLADHSFETKWYKV